MSSKQNQGRKIVVCARVGGANTTPFMAAHFALQNAPPKLMLSLTHPTHSRATLKNSLKIHLQF